MNWIYRLERKLGRGFGVNNVMLYVTATMLAFYMLSLLIMPQLFGFMFFSSELILYGEFWRIITFLFIPPHLGAPLWVLLTLFVAYRIGTSIEYAWGKSLFTMYLILGAIGAVIAGFITGFGSNSYLFLSLILAFCYMNPNATFLLFFILPVKAKYIAIFNWVLYIWAFIAGSFSTRMAIVFSLINFFLFFGPDIWRDARQSYNRLRHRQRYRKNWGDQNPWR